MQASSSSPYPWPEAPARGGWRRRCADVLIGIASAALCTLLGWQCRSWGDLSLFIMLFLVGSVLTALWRGRLASAVATVLGMLAFDFFFETPAYSLSVANWPNFAVFTGFLAISQLVANLVYRLRTQAREALLRERETAALYSLAENLSTEASTQGLRQVAEGALSDLMKLPVHVLPPGSATQEGTVLPLVGPRGSLGSLHVGVPSHGPARAFLEACARQVALALERAQLAEEAEQAHTKAELELTRSTLLSAVSHDFRTPLSTIQAAATTLVQESELLEAIDLHDLAELIVKESSRLDHLVGNLLDLMRLEAGALRPNLEMQPLEEVVGTVLNRLEPLLGSIRADLPDDLPLLPLDSVLVEQLLTNLLENAFKHGAGGQVRLRSEANADTLLVEVADEGPGVPVALRDRVFEKFYRQPGGSADGGVGLGLAICQAIVKLHGGRIWVETSPEGGASFRFTLPLQGSGAARQEKP